MLQHLVIVVSTSVETKGDINMRQSNDEIKGNAVLNGYDYKLQVWVKDGIVQDCGHREEDRHDGYCCESHLYRGQVLATIPGHDIRG